MSKWTRGLALAAAFGVLAAAPLGVAAQEKKATEKKTTEKKPAEKATKAKGGSVEVKETAKGRYYFKILNAEGKFLAGGTPSGQATKEDVLKVLDEIKAALEAGKVVDVPKDEKEKEKEKESK